MMRGPLPIFDGFIETGFEQRFQRLLRLAQRQRSWHVIVAEPGSGKSMGIRDLVATNKNDPYSLRGRSYPVIAVTAPKNDPKEQSLGNYLLIAMDHHTKGRWNEKKHQLAFSLQQYGVECLIIDDAHDLSMQHLIMLKELTDQLRLPPYNRALGLCLVAAGRGSAMPLKDIFDQPETMWIQFRRRLDRVQPYCRIANHTQEELRDILGTLETVYRPHFISLNLQQWTRTIYSWLTHPLLDPHSSGRANMDNVMKLVTTALERSYAQGAHSVTAETLEAASQLIMVHRDSVQVIDAPIVKETQNVINEELTQPTISPKKQKKRGRPKRSETVPTLSEKNLSS